MRNLMRGTALVTIMVMVSGMCGCQPTKTTDSRNKDLELTAWTTNGTDYSPGVKPTENIVEDYLVKKTGVKIINMFGNGGLQWDVKFTQLVVSDNLPQLVQCGSGQGPSQFSKMKESDVLYGLTTEMLQKFAPNMYKRIPVEMWKKFTFSDGKIYGIPSGFEISKKIDPDIPGEIEQYATPNYNSAMIDKTGGFWIRDDILKKIYPEAKSYDEIKKLLDSKNRPIGDELMDIPIHTTDEYIDFMRKIRDLKLKENDKTVYPIGLTNGDMWGPMSWFGADMMGYRGHQYMATWDNNKKVIHMPLIEPIVKQAALNINKMVREKIIDPDSLMQTQFQYNEKVLNGQYAVVPSLWMNPFTTNADLEKAGKPFRYRPFYTQIPNQADYPAFSQPPSWTKAVAIFKKNSDSDIEKILKWMDFMFTDEWEDVRYWGPKEAGLYKDLPDGTRQYTDERFQKFFIHGDSSALQPQEKKGISAGTDPVGYLSMMMFQRSPKYYPRFYNKQFKYMLTNESGANFPSDSQYVKNVAAFPPCTMLSSQYASLESVQKFWSARTQWEDPYRVVLVAQSDEQFNQKWEAAEANMRKLFDIDKMMNDMTQVARTLANEMSEGTKENK